MYSFIASSSKMCKRVAGMRYWYLDGYDQDFSTNLQSVTQVNRSGNAGRLLQKQVFA